MTEAFLKYLQFEKRVSSNTVTAYETDLRQFSDFLKQSFELAQPGLADHGMIRSWIISLAEAKINNRSINRKIACLRSFYKFLLRQEFTTKDPMRKVRILKTSKRLPSFIKETEMVALLDANVFEQTFEGVRDRLMIEMFYATGIRLSELIGLQEYKIDFRNNTIKVLGKRNKERIIPFPKTLTPEIRKYIQLKRNEVAADSSHLFVTLKGTPCYPALVSRIVKKYLSGITVSEKKSPHVLRHTYATHLLNKGAEINAVKDLLGHTSLAATQVYTHNSMEKLKKIFEQAHPKA
ncbi:MAG TPA: tyrosine-type recombinase/integrase [Chryseosolibacter sp.]|nr:tyrosine-type recombinase/integrase [Chryseosolibacter sp.]